jgi:hypothetical protein
LQSSSFAALGATAPAGLRGAAREQAIESTGDP